MLQGEVVSFLQVFLLIRKSYHNWWAPPQTFTCKGKAANIIA
jgi:hypothetical protein